MTIPAFGGLRISASSRGITAVQLGSKSHSNSEPVSTLCERQLKEYFGGRRRQFDLPLDLTGTPFQQSVWKALQTVPFGTTLTYGELAKRVGKPRAVRAVASAVARNPVGVIIPCHRIVPASGKQPGNFAWGTAKKKWLLAHEMKREK